MEQPLCVVVCTHNRPEAAIALAHSLQPTLTALGIKLAVVDSASKPRAAEMLADAFRDTPTHLIRLDQPGVSLARNAGLAWADTEWLAFIDDDELAPPDWGEALIALCARLPDDCAACGGNVVPRWPDANERNLCDRWLDYLSIIRQKGEFDQTKQHRFGIGHSIVRTRAVRAVGGFNLGLGRRGTTLISGEESLLVEQLILAGWTIWHSDAIEVEHSIPLERLSLDWGIKRAYWEGRSQVRILGICDVSAQGRLLRAARLKQPLLRVLSTVVKSQDMLLRMAFVSGVRAEDRQHAEAAE